MADALDLALTCDLATLRLEACLAGTVEAMVVLATEEVVQGALQGAARAEGGMEVAGWAGVAGAAVLAEGAAAVSTSLFNCFDLPGGLGPAGAPGAGPSGELPMAATHNLGRAERRARRRPPRTKIQSQQADHNTPNFPTHQWQAVAAAAAWAARWRAAARWPRWPPSFSA